MNLEREIKVRDAIIYCIENFDSKTATNRIVEFWKDELKIQEQAIAAKLCYKSDSEQLVCLECDSKYIAYKPEEYYECSSCNHTWVK